MLSKFKHQGWAQTLVTRKLGSEGGGAAEMGVVW